VRSYYFEIFPHILNIRAAPSSHDVKPASRPGVDLYTDGASRRKQPFSCRSRIDPGIEDLVRRYIKLACDAGFDGLPCVHCDFPGNGTKPRACCIAAVNGYLLALWNFAKDRTARSVMFGPLHDALLLVV
jgi:hypothetical protein